MEYNELKKREVVEIAGRKFTISAIPCDPSHSIWTEILKNTGGKYGAIAFIGVPLAITSKLFDYICVKDADQWYTLDTESLRERYIPDEGTYLQLVIAMCKKNYGFFFDGSLFLWCRDLQEAKESLE